MILERAKPKDIKSIMAMWHAVNKRRRLLGMAKSVDAGLVFKFVDDEGARGASRALGFCRVQPQQGKTLDALAFNELFVQPDVEASYFVEISVMADHVIIGHGYLKGTAYLTSQEELFRAYGWMPNSTRFQFGVSDQKSYHNVQFVREISSTEYDEKYMRTHFGEFIR